MRKISLFIFMLTTLTVKGQNHLLGVKGGASFTEITARNFGNDRNFRTGITFGFTYDYIYKKHFMTGAEIIYNQCGFTTDIIFTDESGNPIGKKATSRYNYDYITIPLKTGLNFGNSVFAFGNLGLTPSILVNAITTTPPTRINGYLLHGETYNFK